MEGKGEGRERERENINNCLPAWGQVHQRGKEKETREKGKGERKDSVRSTV